MNTNWPSKVRIIFTLNRLYKYQKFKILDRSNFFKFTSNENIILKSYYAKKIVILTNLLGGSFVILKISIFMISVKLWFFRYHHELLTIFFPLLSVFDLFWNKFRGKNCKNCRNIRWKKMTEDSRTMGCIQLIIPRCFSKHFEVFVGS